MPLLYEGHGTELFNSPATYQYVDHHAIVSANYSKLGSPPSAPVDIRSSSCLCPSSSEYQQLNGSTPDGRAARLAAEYTGVVLLNLLSALFSGLVLGLLSLDVTELEILRKCGTERERRYAAAIIPMRKNSNLLLCSLVLANVIVNAGLQMLLDDLFSGIVAFISTTVCITVFGEILPQAVCARYGLAIGARTVCITWMVIVLTFPVAYPLSVVLDCVLGEEISFVYDRERLQEYIRITRNNNNFDAQEINIITGALKLRKMTVSHVMTKLKNVYMLDLNSMINYRTIMDIVKRGFSRIPVFLNSRHNIVGLLMVKDLALVSPYADVTLKSLLMFWKHPLIIVDENHTLDIVMNHFREGKSHMAFVREHKRRDIVGIVTLEDIIEEVLQVEINDETDIVTDNRELKHRPDAQIPNDLDALHGHLLQAITKRRIKERLLQRQQQILDQSGGGGGNKNKNKVKDDKVKNDKSKTPPQRVATEQNAPAQAQAPVPAPSPAHQGANKDQADANGQQQKQGPDSLSQPAQNRQQNSAPRSTSRRMPDT